MQLLTYRWPIAVTSSPAFLLALWVGCAGQSTTGSTDAASAVDAIAVAQTGTIASGQLALPAAGSFEQPGFHEAFVVQETVSARLAPPAGARLIVRLWDADRPDQTCNQEHPLSGCATIDWSDAMGRPNVPESGVFNNHVQVELTQGVRDFYLTESRGLADTQDPYTPS